jgi:hypothetical protein
MTYRLVELLADIDLYQRWNQGSAVDEDYPTTFESLDALDRILTHAPQFLMRAEAAEARIDSAIEWGRSVANDVNILPLMRALGAIPEAAHTSSVAPQPEPAEPKAMQWVNWPHVSYLDGDAAKIVAWVNANGGEARYESVLDPDTDNYSLRIAISQADGTDAYAKPGDWIAMNREVIDYRIHEDSGLDLPVTRIEFRVSSSCSES